MSRGHELSWEEYEATLQPHERPTMPGSPANPEHPWRRRVAYGATGALVALTGSLGNAAVSANIRACRDRWASRRSRPPGFPSSS